MAFTEDIDHRLTICHNLFKELAKTDLSEKQKYQFQLLFSFLIFQAWYLSIENPAALDNHQAKPYKNNFLRQLSASLQDIMNKTKNPDLGKELVFFLQKIWLDLKTHKSIITKIEKEWFKNINLFQDKKIFWSPDDLNYIYLHFLSDKNMRKREGQYQTPSKISEALFRLSLYYSKSSQNPHAKFRILDSSAGLGTLLYPYLSWAKKKIPQT